MMSVTIVNVSSLNIYILFLKLNNETPAKKHQSSLLTLRTGDSGFGFMIVRLQAFLTSFRDMF